MKKIYSIGLAALLLISQFSFAQITELWGTNFRGGDDGMGRIVRVDAAGTTVSEAHKFPAQYAGRTPDFTRFIKYGNYLYSTTPFAGKFNGGVLFRYDPVTNVSEKLYNFSAAGGNNPYGALLFFQNEFYGIASTAGANNKGTIYSFNPATNVYTKRADLTAAIGGFSNNTLAAFNGKLYATTNDGGAGGFGTIFEFDPATNTLTKKIDLANDAVTGRSCQAGLTLFNNKFYGAMRFGGAYGLIFEWDPSTNIYTNKVTLTEADGRDYTGGFIAADTALFATFNQGTGTFGQGGISSYNPTANRLVTKINFAFATGAGSFSDLTFFNNKYYGSNTVGGANSKGGFFEWDPALNSITKRVAGANNIGENPTATPAEFNGKMYCAFEYETGNYASGSLAEWDLTANTLVKKFDFSANTGANINTKLVYANNKVYGITPSGGTFNKGVIFSIDVNTNAYTVLYNFPANATGSYGISSPAIFNNKIYGAGASTSTYGAIYEFDLATNTFTQKFALTTAGGYGMIGQFYLHTNNKFYGVSRYGGSSGSGTVFSYDPATNVFTNLTNLGSNYGVQGMFTPFGSKFYVPAPSGGNANNDGGVLEFDPATNQVSLPVVFSLSTGNNAQGEFALINNVLYTACTYGGGNQAGTIIGYVPGTGIVSSSAFAFGTGSGSYPVGLLHAYNNQLYGFAMQGGANNSGTTFRFTPSGGVITKLEDHYTNFNLSQPGNGFITIQRSAVVALGLSNFRAVKLNEAQSLLTWNIASRDNIREFAIERSTDGVHYAGIGTVNINAGDNNSGFRFTDRSPSRGMNHYRIRQQRNAGANDLSNVRSLQFDGIKYAQVYPNPVEGTINIANGTSAQGIIAIYDMQGKMILRAKLLTGRNQIDASNFTAGTYSYKIQFDNGTAESGEIIKR